MVKLLQWSPRQRQQQRCCNLLVFFLLCCNMASTLAQSTLNLTGQNVMPTPVVKFNSYQKYSLFFTLDGPTGSGALTNRSQVQQLVWFMQNVTYSFVPDFATSEEVDEVFTRCTYRRQQSFDNVPDLPEGVIQTLNSQSEAASIRRRKRAFRAFQTRQDDLLTDFLLSANTTYEYIYDMNYSSATVDVANYTIYYEDTIPDHYPRLEETLRAFLQVTSDKTLTVQGVYLTSETDDLIPPSNLTTPAPVFPTLPPTMMPTVSASPSFPTASPSMAPSLYPTIFGNSTSRGRYDFFFVVHGANEPTEMFLNSTIFCQIMQSLTPLFAPEGDRVDQVVETTCPTVDGGYSLLDKPTRPPLTALPTMPPNASGLLPTDTDYDLNDADEPDSLLEETNTTIETEDFMSNSTRSLLEELFSAGEMRQLQSDTNKTRILWTYTLVIRYASPYVNVTDYPDLLEDFVNDNPDVLTEALIEKFELGEEANVTIQLFRRVFDQTIQPSVPPAQAPSWFPTFYTTHEPTLAPTNSSMPTLVPSFQSSNMTLPNGTDTIPPEYNTTTIAPSATPSPTSNAIPLVPATKADDKTVLITVVTTVSIVAALLMIGLFVFFQRRQAKLQLEANKVHLPRPSYDSNVNQESGYPSHTQVKVSTAGTVGSISPSVMSTPPKELNEKTIPSSSLSEVKEQEQPDDNVNASTSTVTSLVDVSENIKSSTTLESMREPSSLLSDIEEDAYSNDDDNDFVMEKRHTSRSKGRSRRGGSGEPPMDDFDQFKDKNLEKMRSRVESNVAGIDDMMSQAMTIALMSDGSGTAPSWHGATTGVEIEANALWEVTDWLRRYEGSSDDDKQDYMKYLLNKMVTSVRFGILGPEDASRTIHECAALLGLELAHQLPVTTIILTGMQKTTTSKDVIDTFRAFGSVEDAAVASNQRGFGLVRFKNQNAANLAMQRFRNSEIVVRDVAITLRILSPILASQRKGRG